MSTIWTIFLRIHILKSETTIEASIAIAYNSEDMYTDPARKAEFACKHDVTPHAMSNCIQIYNNLIQLIAEFLSNRVDSFKILFPSYQCDR